MRSPTRKSYSFGNFALISFFFIGCANPNDDLAGSLPLMDEQSHPCYEGMTAEQIQNQNLYTGSSIPSASYATPASGRGKDLVIEYKTRAAIRYQFPVVKIRGFFQAGISEAHITAPDQTVTKTNFPLVYVEGVDDRFHQLPRFNIRESGRCLIFEAKQNPDKNDMGLHFLRDDGLNAPIVLPKNIRLKDYEIFDQLTANQNQFYFRVKPSTSGKRICKSVGSNIKKEIKCLDVIPLEDDRRYSITSFNLTAEGDLFVVFENLMLRLPRLILRDLQATRVTTHIDRYTSSRNLAADPMLSPLGNSLIYRNNRGQLNMVKNGINLELDIKYNDEPYVISDQATVRISKCKNELCIRNLSNPDLKYLILHVNEEGKTFFEPVNI